MSELRQAVMRQAPAPGTVLLPLLLTTAVFLALPLMERITERAADYVIRPLDVIEQMPAIPEPQPVRTAVQSRPVRMEQRPELLRPSDVQMPSMPLSEMADMVRLDALPVDPAMAVFDIALAAGGPVDLSALDVIPIPVSRMDPVYPASARARGIEGFVTLEFVIGEDGRVSSARVTDSVPGGIFDDASVRAVGSWRFRPGEMDGRPVAVKVRQTLNFKLKE
ncbi:MAG TPA: energy transducer TonB [Kiritimatiellia bacterium]|nr:energy transducer TonB [Kiritimatiellia bacterium]HQQ03745.1 energy transducer TonB [Kiritimatiellia bacterium]